MLDATSLKYFVALLFLIIGSFVISYAFEKAAQIRDRKKGKKVDRILNQKALTVSGIFGAIAFIVMFFEFPLLFIAPFFYNFDFSDIPALIVGFAEGPVAGVMVEFIKIALKALIRGTKTSYVGEIANFVIGSAFVTTASIIYRFKKTRKGALIGCISGTLVITIVGALLNMYFMIPVFAMFWGGLDGIIQEGTNIFPFVDSTFELCLFCVAPFNLIKGIVDSIITFILYKKLSRIIKADHHRSKASKKDAIKSDNSETINKE